MLVAEWRRTDLTYELPGAEGIYDRDGIGTEIERSSLLDNDRYCINPVAFISEVVSVAEDAAVVLAIHPDDPLFSLFGLPRVISTADDARKILNAVPSPAGALTMCAGSSGACGDNHLVAMNCEFDERFHFFICTASNARKTARSLSPVIRAAIMMSSTLSAFCSTPKMGGWGCCPVASLSPCDQIMGIRWATKVLMSMCGPAIPALAAGMDCPSCAA